jgi:hypothetical protein
MLRVALRQMLDKHPPAGPVERVTLRAEELVRPAAFQRTLLGDLSRAERTHATDSALKVMEARFGSGAIRPARQVQIPRRLKVLRAWRDATGWR